MTVSQLITALSGTPHGYDVTIDGDGADIEGIIIEDGARLVILSTGWMDDDAPDEETSSSDRDDDPAGMAGHPYV